MTRKDYQLIAESFGLLPSAQTMADQAARERTIKVGAAPAYANGYRAAIVKMVDAIGAQLAKDNPAFQIGKFRAACGCM